MIKKQYFKKGNPYNPIEDVRLYGGGYYRSYSCFKKYFYRSAGYSSTNSSGVGEGVIADPWGGILRELVNGEILEALYHKRTGVYTVKKLGEVVVFLKKA